MEERTDLFDETTTPPPAESQTPPKKKSINLRPLAVIFSTLTAAAAAVYLFLFFTVIQPNNILADAKIALKNQDFLQCEALLNCIPTHQETSALRRQLNFKMVECYIAEEEFALAESILANYPGDAQAKALRSDIQYSKATDLVSQEQYADAKRILDQIPEHEDPQQLREQISYQNALALAETGDYQTAYELLLALGDFQDAAQQKDSMYYEALLFKSLLHLQSELNDPASLRLTEVTFYTNRSTDGELDVVCTLTATNGFGGRVTGYAYDETLYDDNDDSVLASTSKYKRFIKNRTEFEVSIDIARMNRLLNSAADLHLDLPFKSGAVVEN